jgi:hypothetical protein
MTTWALASATVLALTLGAAPASADVDGGTGDFEVYAGWLWPDEPSGVDLDDATYGIRLGYNVTEHFGILGSLGYWDASDAVTGGIVNENAWFFDVSFEWIVNPDSNTVFVLYGGPGLVSYDASFDTKTVGLSDWAWNSDDLTFHAGVTGRLGNGGRWYVRPDLRVRWIDNDNPLRSGSAQYDYEATVALGWYLGGR